MAFELRPFVQEDTMDFVRLHYRAFANSISPVLFSGPPSEACYAVMARQRANIIASPDILAFKAVDAETGQMVGAAYYHVAPTGISQDTLDSSEPSFTEFGAEQIGDLWKAWGKKMKECYADVVGTSPCIEVLMMAVEPTWQGKGVGKALLTKGCDEADRLDCITYLEATDAGIPMYEKAGFKTVGTVDFDARPWWHGGRFPVDTIMVRQPKRT